MKSASRARHTPRMEIDRSVFGTGAEGDGLPASAVPEPHLAFYVEHAPTAMLFLNPVGRVVYANTRFWSLFEGTFIDRTTQPLTMYHLSGFDEAFLASMRGLLAGRSTSFIHTSIFRMGPETTGAPLTVRGGAILDGRGALQGAMLTFEEAQLPASLPPTPAPSDDWLAQMQHVFIHTMSHEFRTPLGAINGYADLLHQELEELRGRSKRSWPPQVDEFVSAIQDNTQRLLQLTGELFDLSNMRQLNLLPVGLHEVLRPLAQQTGETLARKNVRFEMELDGDEVMVRSDRKRLIQVLDILLSNAAKFTDQGQVRLTTRQVGGIAEVAVEDTGIGMSREFMDMLFTPFTQEDDRLNRSYPGAGLGLALAKLFVGLMDGRIEVASEKGVGSTFRLVLPLA